MGFGVTWPPRFSRQPAERSKWLLRHRRRRNRTASAATGNVCPVGQFLLGGGTRRRTAITGEQFAASAGCSPARRSSWSARCILWV